MTNLENAQEKAVEIIKDGGIDHRKRQETRESRGEDSVLNKSSYSRRDVRHRAEMNIFHSFPFTPRERSEVVLC